MISSRFTHASRLAFILPAALVAFAPALHAQAQGEEAELGESPERYAQVKALDGEAIIRKGDTEEALTRGTPVAEGDVVESRARGVLQLGDGTRIAFGPETRFRVAALFADKDGTREVLLRLDYGRLRVRVGSQSDAAVRIDTPSGSGTVADTAEATFEVGRDKVVRFRVHGGRTNFTNDRGHLLVRAGERLTVYSNQDTLDRVNDFNTYDEDDFDRWAEPNLAARRGESANRVPPEIRYYADDLDDHGRWVYVDELSKWCWTPSGVAADWRPYYDGRWSAYAGGMTWISAEPWGYVTHHHGRWGWGASFGWYWIPGVYYSPAWVAWQSESAYFGWAPLGYYNRPCNWGYGAWGGGYCWNVVDINYINARNLHSRIHNEGGIIVNFNRGNAATAWTPSGGAPRGGGGSGPWFRGRMMVTPTEFRNPVQIQHVASQRDLVQARVTSYDQASRAATGRVILRREGPPASLPVPRGEAPQPRGFEGERPRTSERPILRESPQTRPATPGGIQVRPAESRPGFQGRPQPGVSEGRPEPVRERPRMEERRLEPVQRPRMEERRPEPMREAPRPEIRVAPREMPRQEIRSSPSTSSAPREAPRQESRPAPAPRQEARPARETKPSEPR